ncbi:MAG: PspC domain-containing protein [Clostridiaceae bacterium]|nr:PspC domain-containing protein [Clostridiaceae bacterium]
MEKRLYKSSTDKMLEGVCGGVAEYFEVDSTLVRIGYAAMIIFAGTGILLYIICAIVMPVRPR